MTISNLRKAQPKFSFFDVNQHNSVLSRALIGTWSLGGKHFGSYDQAEAIALLKHAYDHGLRCYDSAAFYAKGASDAVLRKSLRGYNPDSYHLCLKAGLRWEGNKVVHDGSAACIVNEVRSARSFFSKDTLDMVVLHWPDPARDLREACDALSELREKGVVRRWGLANLTESDWAVVKHYDMDACHLHFNPIHKHTGGLLAQIHEASVITMVFSVFEQGLLVNSNYLESAALGKRDVRRRNRYFHNAALRQELQALFSLDTHGFSFQHCVLHWVLQHGVVDACILGPRYVYQLEALLNCVSSPTGLLELESSPFYEKLSLLHNSCINKV